MAAGQLHLVLAVLILVGPVLGIDADLREQDIEDHGGIIKTLSVNIETRRNKGCRLRLNGTCFKLDKPCPPDQPLQTSPGQPFCYTRNLRCCYPGVDDTQIEPKSCIFGGTAFAHNSVLNESCFELQCKHGIWNYTGNYDTWCGNCTFGGDPHIYTFDSVEGKTNYAYSNNGEYIMAQPSLGDPNKPAEFGVNSHFIHKNCTYGIDWCKQYPNEPECYKTCVDGATYYEPGITISLILPDANHTDYCNGNAPYSSPAPKNDPLCTIKVFVNDIKRTIEDTVKILFGTDGALLVFKHKYIGSSLDVNCISIVGTKGLTLAVCERYMDYSYSYILPVHRLETTPSTLYGLCNTWTGKPADNFTMSDGTSTLDPIEFGQSWEKRTKYCLDKLSG